MTPPTDPRAAALHHLDALTEAIARLKLDAPVTIPEVVTAELATWRKLADRHFQTTDPHKVDGILAGEPIPGSDRELLVLRTVVNDWRARALDAGRELGHKTRRVDELEGDLAGARATIARLQQQLDAAKSAKPSRARKEAAPWSPGDEDRKPVAETKRAAPDLPCKSCAFGTEHKDAHNGYMCGKAQNRCQPGRLNALYERKASK